MQLNIPPILKTRRLINKRILTSAATNRGPIQNSEVLLRCVDKVRASICTNMQKKAATTTRIIR